MMRPLPLIVLIALLAGPGLAAGPTKEKDAKEVDKTAEAEARLPNSMRRHGVIGHVPPMEGLPLLDAEVLERMRERLIVLSQAAEQ